jgi:hypothetical protein
MLIGNESGGVCLSQDFSKEGVGDLALEQPVTILGERGRVPHGIVHAQAHEPAKQQVVLELFHQQAFAANRIQTLEQQRAEQFLGGNRRPADVRVQPIESWRQPIGDRIGHATDGAQRVVRRHALLGRDVAEHPAGLSIITAHRHAPFKTVGSIVVRRDHDVDPLEVTFSAPCSKGCFEPETALRPLLAASEQEFERSARRPLSRLAE